MRSRKNQRKVEKALRDALKPDRARTNVGRISPNGLLEINRQRIQQALSLRTHRACPTCAGTGRIASPEMVGLNLLRRIAGRAASAPLSRVRVLLHPELADAFQNGRRREIFELEQEFDIRVEVVAASHLHRSDQQIEWFQRDKVEEQDAQGRERPREDLASIRASVLAVPEKKKPGKGPAKDEEPGNGKSRRRKPRKKKAAKPEAGDEAAETPSQPPTRRRRRRRRKSRGGPGETEPPKTAAQPAQETKPDEGESPTGTSSRRRRRRRTARGDERKKSGEAGA